MNYYNEIKNELINNEINKKVKNYSINRSDLNTYYNVGKMLSEAGKHYGEGIIKEYSKRLMNETKIKYDVSSLNKMKKFYLMSEKVATVSPNLSYSHYVELLSIEDINKINYYIKISEDDNLSVRQLREKIKTNDYERSYMNYYNEIKNKIIDNEVYLKVKDYSKERNTVLTYFEIGKLLNEAGGKYGDKIIDEYSKKLVLEVGKKYNRSTLFRMKQLYLIFNNEKVAPLVQQLTWSHCLILIPLKDMDEIYYYASQVKEKRLTKRQLQEIVKNKEYSRLPHETKIKLIENKKADIKDLVPDPILIKNKSNKEIISEKVLQKLILEDISSFLKELGNGYSFIDSEYKIKIGNTYNYIDLLLFNIEFNCYVVVELKITKLKKEHIGQIQVYMNYIDKNIKKINQNKTIGIIICKKNNKFVIEYCSDPRVVSREYELI